MDVILAFGFGVATGMLASVGLVTILFRPRATRPRSAFLLRNPGGRVTAAFLDRDLAEGARVKAAEGRDVAWWEIQTVPMGDA